MTSDAPSLGFGVPREEGVPGPKLLRRVQVGLVVSLVAANVLGALIVVALGVLVLPLPDVEDETTVRVANFIAAGAFLLVFVPVGSWWGLRRLRGARAWLQEDREPTAEERRLVLRGPRRIVFVHMVIWGFGAVFFGVLNAIYSLEAGARVATLVGFAGLSVCTFVYLIAERQLRPAAARALAAGIGDRRLGPGIKTRVMTAWAMASAVPVLGMILIGISTLAEGDFTADELALVMIALGGSTLLVGFYALFLASRAIADPVVSLRQAVGEVEEGDLDVSAPVYDGSEIGQLQAGFNRMVAGLREREHIHDLFGRHVGEDVAKAALESDVELGGESRDVSVLFVDMIGSTSLAGERPPQEVVGTLNRFFAVVIEVVHAHGGWVNKFEGDAALAVFGAPVPLDDHASKALAAARDLASRLHAESDYDAGIGVSSGEVVAGNIGEEHRFEYTVIGDPVNEAARLTELAKSEGGVLASDAALEAASADEAARWVPGEAVGLRGRSRSTRPAKPVA